MRLIRLVRLAVILLLALLLVLVAMANRASVPVHLLPSDFVDFLGIPAVVQVPLFLVILGAGVIGLIVGFVWEWLRESKHRANAATGERRVTALAREVGRLREAQSGGRKDEVLALLDRPARKR
ncbi:MAG: LapA family protein [Paracoccaceae bacterium]|nr:LapA family protein [Paracoccaceae bacterium]MDE3120990.1 LapA family protein [Paracoccaceae bacterium]MDE3237552.1 LapA family protein [Paracoccaceae bacterium]